MIVAIAHPAGTKITGHALYRRTSGVCMRTLEAVRRCRHNGQLIVEGHIIGVAEIDMTHRSGCVVHTGRRHGEDAQFFDEVLMVFDAQMGDWQVRPLAA